jgi:hypothetical protein
MENPMTIFDSLKYPVSDKPTLRELLNVPPDIFADWVKKCYGVNELNGELHSPQSMYMYLGWNPHVDHSE